MYTRRISYRKSENIELPRIFFFFWCQKLYETRVKRKECEWMNERKQRNKMKNKNNLASQLGYHINFWNICDAWDVNPIAHTHKCQLLSKIINFIATSCGFFFFFFWLRLDFHQYQHEYVKCKRVSMSRKRK